MPIGTTPLRRADGSRQIRMSSASPAFIFQGFLSPWLSLTDIVAEFLAARRDAALLQVWSNTVLGEPTEPKQEAVEGSALLRRGENYGPQSIPDQVQLLSAGVDVQADRLEVQIIGFGAHEEVVGGPLRGLAWRSGTSATCGRCSITCSMRPTIPMPAASCGCRATCVDSGGHHQHHVLTYCLARRRRNRLPDQGRVRAAARSGRRM